MKEATIKHNHLKRRHFLKTALAGAIAAPALCALDALAIEPHWVELVEQPLPLPNLPDAFLGRRLVQISDLHCSRVVSADYLNSCIDRVNQLAPDAVLLTGDYITYEGRNGYPAQVIDVIGRLRAGLGICAGLGNHDYGFLTRFHQAGRADLCQTLVEGLSACGVHVLRNRATPLTLDGKRLWIVGLGDLWSNNFQPDLAFRQVPAHEPAVALSHNPDTIDALASFPAGAVLCGHTHGGQINIPFFGPPFLPIKNRLYYAGMFSVAGKRLYVNRGLGRLGRLRFNCRPEITLFTLTRA